MHSLTLKVICMSHIAAQYSTYSIAPVFRYCADSALFTITITPMSLEVFESAECSS